jgi:hypothetical protein
MNDVTKTTCLNCSAELKGSFCHQCGQSASVGKITFKETLTNFFSSTFALESQLFKSIRLLLANPGLLFREFLGGKRKRYYKPVAFFVVTTALYILLRQLIGYDPLEGQMIQSANQSHPMQRLSMEAARFMVDNINNIMFTLVFSIGLMLKTIFRKRYNLAEYISVAFFIAGMYILFGVVFMLTFHSTGNRENQWQLIVLFLYLAYCIWSFFKIDSLGGFVKAAFASAFSIFLYMVFGFGVSLLLVWLKGMIIQ